MCLHCLPGEEMAADALWEKGRPTEGVLWSGQCSAGKPWVLHPCGCYFDMHHQPKDCCRPCTTLMTIVFSAGSGLFQQDNAPATLQTLFRNGLSTWQSSRCCLGLQKCLDLNPTEHLSWDPHLTTCWTPSLMLQSCFGSTGGICTILGRWF